MAYRVSVPAVEDRSAVVVLCRAVDESTAINLAEHKIGYRVIGLPYVLTDISDEEAQRLGIEDNSAVIAEGHQ